MRQKTYTQKTIRYWQKKSKMIQAEKYNMFLNWKNQCHQNDCPTQSNTWFNEIPIKWLITFSSKLEQNYLQFVLKHKRPQIAKSILIEKKGELKESCFLTWNYATKPESWYDTGKTQTYSSVTQVGTPGIYPHTCGQLIYDKGKNISWRKTVFSICGAGKTGQLYVKE